VFLYFSFVCTGVTGPGINRLSTRFEGIQGNAIEQGPPESDDPLYHFIRAFQHQEFLAGSQGNHRVGRHFNVFDEIRVDNQRNMVQPGQVDHTFLFGRSRRKDNSIEFSSRADLCWCGDRIAHWASMDPLMPDNDDLSPGIQEQYSLETETPVFEVFDFRRPDRIAKSQIRAIHLLHENFVRSAVSSLSAYLRTYLSMSLVSVEQLSYSQFLERLPTTTCMACLGLKPYEGSAILEINPTLVFPILEILLGGAGKVAVEIQREVTEIEQTLMDGLFRIIVNDLTEAWKSITLINFTIQSVNTEPQFLQIMAPNEAILAVTIEIRIGDSIGCMNIAMPSLMIKMMRQKFDHQRSTRKSEPTSEEQARVLDLIRPSRIEIDARLLDQQICAKDLLALRRGDVLAFDIPMEAPADLILNGKRFFRGNIVSAGNKRAFSLNGTISA
jgi:flagellar motor switch protein FliM